MKPDRKHVLLSGIVGSTAYGLARPGSDIDRLGVFALPTEQLFGFGLLSYSSLDNYQHHDPDIMLHEVLKYCSLASRCNPAVLELLWLPDEFYETRTVLGERLIEIREVFLSAESVRRAYLGYATQQIARMNRGSGPGITGSSEKRAKYAWHVKRLLDQGLHLYRTGHLQVQVTDPESYFEFGQSVGNSEYGNGRLADIMTLAEDAFNASDSPLPDEPDKSAIEAWLRRVRWHFLDPDIPLT